MQEGLLQLILTWWRAGGWIRHAQEDKLDLITARLPLPGQEGKEKEEKKYQQATLHSSVETVLC